MFCLVLQHVHLLVPCAVYCVKTLVYFYMMKALNLVGLYLQEVTWYVGTFCHICAAEYVKPQQCDFLSAVFE